MNEKISLHNRSLEARRESLSKWGIPSIEIKKINEFLHELSLGKVNLGKQISPQRQLKYLDILKIPLTYFKKEMEKVTLKEMEKFESDLTSNKLKSHKGKPYAQSTKADIRKQLRTYLRWRLGGGKKFIELTSWFDTRVKQRTPDYLTEQEINKLYKACKTDWERYLICVLFDSGARIEEFVNIRYEDLQLPEGNDSYVKLTLKEEYSKTKGRTISLYWKYSLEAVRDYIRKREQEGIKRDEQVCNKTYDSIRVFLLRFGKKVLNKSIHPHLFRHSSATYYAPKMNRQQLCYRYGWKFSSDMPDVYISRAGLENKELDQKFNSTELDTLKVELDRLKEQNKIKTEESKLFAEKLNKYEEEFKEIRKMFSKVVRK